ncbi:hypothetical protein DPMN_039291 [Dreissena polymorpha]|uniref:Uncharacterized protein n=1 Tax=Dreissena polymorpha TaxID=45954 RepID=A0A9D4MIL3_DREPO|nr:hypothetical protein DPMN_039291 [Dreissena polymorpha]
MLKRMKIPPLQERRKANRLIFFKVVEWLVQTLPSQDFLIHIARADTIGSFSSSFLQWDLPAPLPLRRS